MTAAGDVEGLAEGLARAARWAGHLPEYETRTVLRGWLAERLGGRPTSEIRLALEELLKACGPAPEAPAEAPMAEVAAAGPAAPVAPEAGAEPAGAPVPLDRLFAFAQRYYGDLWQPSGTPRADAERALDALEEMEARLKTAAPGSTGAEASLRQDLTALEARLAATDAALRSAARDSLSRLLQALSPAALEAQAGRKGVKLGVFHKASLYEAWCEKFGQLQAYHDAGRLVADLRDSFKKNLREAGREEQKA